MQLPSRRTASDEIEPPQFSIRGVLVVTTVCAVALAILAPIVRAQTHEQRMALGIGYLVLLSMLAFAALLVRQKSRTVLKQSGERLYLTGQSDMTWSHRVTILLGIALVCFVWPLVASKGLNMLPIPAQNILVCVVVIAAAFDSRRIDFRTNGIVFARIHFIPWEKIKSYHWSGSQSDKLVLKYSRYGSSKLNVPAADREAVERILKEHVPDPQAKRVAAIA